MNVLTGYRKSNHVPINRLINPSNNIIYDTPITVNDALASHFVVNTEKKIPDEILLGDIRLYENSYNSSELHGDFNLITAEEVCKAVNDTKKDSISDFFVPLPILKRCNEIVSFQLAILFNIIFINCRIPEDFKTTYVTPIYKGKGQKLSPNNYRPISCLITYCKLFERVLFNRIQTRLESRLCNQHGFRCNRSCHTALAELTNYIYSALDKPGGKCVAIYFEAKSAFNSIDRSLLINKLMIKYKLHPIYIKTIHNYVNGTLFKFKNTDKYYDNPTGIIQGGTIGPVIFGAYQDDIADVITLPFLLYADDLVIYIAGTDLDVLIEVLKSQTILIQQWYEDNNMTLNYDKTKFQIFCKNHSGEIC